MPIPDSNTPSYANLRKQIDTSLELCRETPSLDFKQAEPWGTLQLRLTKSIIAMSNLRDGGMLIIGVRESGDAWEFDGVEVPIRETYDHDDIADFVASYSSPPVTVNTITHSYLGKQFVVIVVEPFQETPTVVKKTSPPGIDRKSTLVKGDFLIRPNGKPRTIRVEEESQMHSILDIATEKRSQRFLRTSQNIGLKLPLESEKQFEKQFEGRRPLPAEFGCLPTWSYLIRGDFFNDDRVQSLSELKEVLEACRVSRNGEGFPCALLDLHNLKTDAASLSYSEILTDDAYQCREFWQFWQSGQFYFVEAVREKVNERLRAQLLSSPMARMLSQSVSSTGMIALKLTLYRFVELHEFIRRLSNKGLFESRILLTVKLDNANGFLLVSDTNGLLRSAQRVSTASITLSFNYGIDEIQTSTRELILKAFNRMLESCFAWTGLPPNAFAAELDDYSINGIRFGWAEVK